MSKSQSGADYGALFEKVTGETSVVDEQDAEEAENERAVEDDLAAYIDESTRDDGLDEAVAEPDT
jgi:erythromycin esterase-like protein